MTSREDPLSTIDGEELLHEVVSAGRAHRRWVSRWHRQVLCRLLRDAEFTEPGGHLLCRFGRWHQELTSSAHAPKLKRLGETHEVVHELGEGLARAALAGSAIDTSVYDSFARVAEEFARGVLDFERALRDRLAERDPLTDVPNRRAMLSRLEDERERLEHRGGSACLAMIDIDHFKKVNDTYGHPVGDAILRKVTQRLREEIRPYDMLFRYGGDEFLICLRDVSLSRATTILERIRERAKRVDVDSIAGAVTLSIGACELLADRTIDETIGLADAALYRAKQAGRDRVQSDAPAPSSARPSKPEPSP